jgi:hypothetical protein
MGCSYSTSGGDDASGYAAEGMGENVSQRHKASTCILVFVFIPLSKPMRVSFPQNHLPHGAQKATPTHPFLSTLGRSL